MYSENKKTITSKFGGIWIEPQLKYQERYSSIVDLWTVFVNRATDLHDLFLWHS